MELNKVKKALEKSRGGVPLLIKIRMAQLVSLLSKNRRKFGLLVILGWNDRRWKNYADTPDISQDLFAKSHINIMKPPPPVERRRRQTLVKTVKFDGAILIDRHGNILHSGAMIEGLRPRATAHKLNPRRTSDLSTQFGFRRKVHMRHITAITSSYAFKGTTVFTVSEETDDVHIFENGKIIFSTVRGEPAK